MPATEAETHEALDNAWEAGYDFNKWTVSEMVLDLMYCWSGAEDTSEADLERYVRSWRVQKGLK